MLEQVPSGQLHGRGFGRAVGVQAHAIQVYRPCVGHIELSWLDCGPAHHRKMRAQKIQTKQNPKSYAVLAHMLGRHDAVVQLSFLASEPESLGLAK